MVGYMLRLSTKGMLFLHNPDLTRLDRWLKRQYPHLTQGLIEKLLRQGKIRVNAQKATAGTRVSESDSITVPKNFINNLNLEIPRKIVTYQDEDIEFLSSLIIWEDDELCVLNKPSGLATQGGTKTHHHLDGLLQAYGKGKPFRLVHRLDRDTSGIMVVAKTLKMSIHLANAFKNRQVQKTYWAIVHGLLNEKQGAIEAPISKDSGLHREKMMVDFETGKPARTTYKVIKSLAKKASWVEFKPETGRTHQLRVHAAYIDHAIIGDSKYSSVKEQPPLYLHARKISFPDMNGKRLTFVAKPPHHIDIILKEFDINWEDYT
jgi:23S rRNA pseudouridine955/2504/2580 synthase